MAYHDWHVGMKVVCVSEKYRPGSAPAEGDVPNLPHEGRVYTVRGFHESGNIWLEEVRNRRERWKTGFHEYAFHSSRFRPVQHRKTDISTFTAMLNSQKHEVDA